MSNNKRKKFLAVMTPAEFLTMMTNNNKRRKFLVGYADCMYCDAEVKLFVILPGLDSEEPELVTDHLCNHLRRKKDRPGSILIRFTGRISRIEKEAKL